MTLIIPSQRQGIWDHFLKALAQQHWSPHPYHPYLPRNKFTVFINMKGRKCPVEFCNLISRSLSNASSKSGRLHCLLGCILFCSVLQIAETSPHLPGTGQKHITLSFLKQHSKDFPDVLGLHIILPLDVIYWGILLSAMFCFFQGRT